ncbi:MAG: penicillin acylase family protein [candidate division Zixibacteria bacterium]|nr:penicillin acylase family protein [candidate division Zixibacteria bacterium]
MPINREKHKGRYRWLKISALIIIGIPLVLLAIMTTFILTSGWKALYPEKLSTAERLRMFPSAPLPLNNKVLIYWDDYQIPFIDAEDDRDCAFALGMVHAHLRGGQMDFFRRASQGRLAEIAGPVAANIDVAIQTLDLGYVVDEIYANMDPHARGWLDSFIEGINFYLSNCPKRPPESGLMNFTAEPYTYRDILTMARLVGADVNWFVFLASLPNRSSSNWKQTWDKQVETGTSGTASFREHKQLARLRQLIEGMSRSGSNSVAISPAKSAYNSAIIANDPHLGITIPNFFMLAGFKSPSYHCVGMMIPGIPFMALGRNPHLAWGGTNMRAASSDLYDVSGIPDNQITETSKKLNVRWWLNREFTVRRTPLGPILTDAKIIPSRDGDTIAIKWVGHQVSDEIGAFLRANRAENIPAFVEAFRGYAVSAQNLLVADTMGNIAMTLAARIPVRSYQKPPDVVLNPSNPDHLWDGYLEAPDLPVAFNPEDGFIASANNKPTEHDPPIGFFFTVSERIDRLKYLVGNCDSVDIEFIKKLQTDVYSAFSDRLKFRWIEFIDKFNLTDSAPELVVRLKGWDGHYDHDSRGPVAFETLTYYIAYNYLGNSAESYVYKNWNYIANHLADDIAGLPADKQKSLIDSSLVQANEQFAKFRTWGEMHRLGIGYVLRWFPVLGSRFRYAEFPASGSRETVMKTNHDLVKEKGYATYGSQSRHISIMDNPDNNYFTLLGGNDGWLGSENLTDHVQLWREVDYIKLPLTLENVKKRCRYHMSFTPGESVKLEVNENASDI